MRAKVNVLRQGGMDSCSAHAAAEKNGDGHESAQNEWLGWASGGDAMRKQRARLQKRGRKRRGRDIDHEVADACRLIPPVRNLGLESDRD